MNKQTATGSCKHRNNLHLHFRETHQEVFPPAAAWVCSRTPHSGIWQAGPRQHSLYNIHYFGLFHRAYIPRLWIHMSYWLIFVRTASLTLDGLHDRSNPEDYEPMGTIDRELTKQHTTIHKSWAHFVGCTANPRVFNNQKGVTAPAVPLHCPRTPHNGNQVQFIDALHQN